MISLHCCHIFVSYQTFKKNIMTTTKTQFNYAFTIFKTGMTAEPVNIVYPLGQPYNIQAKKAFYEYLGYTVTFNK